MRGHLASEERLDILRKLDTERKWYALDDQRVCAVCDRVFTGRQIEIDRDGHGSFRLRCPTPECPSSYHHWFLCSLSPARHGVFADGDGAEPSQ